MQITIAGYGNIGRFVEETFAPYGDVAIYDPPLGMGCEASLREADYVFICVPTPSHADGRCDTSRVEEVVRLARPRRAIVCHSTIAIGTTDRLRETYHKPLVFVPEYAGESAAHPYRQKRNRDFFIIGGYQPEAGEVRRLFERAYVANVQYSVVPPVEAEVTKYMENAFLALKVGFVNEFFDLCQAVGADFATVRSLWLQDVRVGASHTQVTPERGYGGACLPKDVAAVCATARDQGERMELLEALQEANARWRVGVPAGLATARHARRP